MFMGFTDGGDTMMIVILSANKPVTGQRSVLFTSCGAKTLHRTFPYSKLVMILISSLLSGIHQLLPWGW